jgi:Fe2+-dicitrate sensor, membrane component
MNTPKTYNEQIELLIIDYLAGEISRGNMDILNQWIGESDENRNHFDLLRNIWTNASSGSSSEFDADEAYQRFKIRIDEYKKQNKVGRRFVINPFLRGVAATVALFLIGSLAYYFVVSGNKSAKSFAITVPYGSKTKVTLPDQSVVWVNAGSTLSYSDDFGHKTRRVELDGEAYFEVTKNKKIPFIVQGKDLSVRVHGTKFDVKSYREDPTVDVTLLEGSVSLTKAQDISDKSLLMKPGERATFSKSGKRITIADVDATNSNAWTRGALIFEEEKFGQIIKRLEREYNVEINVQNRGLLEREFYGDFRRAQSIIEILDIMTENNKFHYTMKENKITVF